jgi:hypothetical protein
MRRGISGREERERKGRCKGGVSEMKEKEIVRKGEEVGVGGEEEEGISR